MLGKIHFQEEYISEIQDAEFRTAMLKAIQIIFVVFVMLLNSMLYIFCHYKQNSRT